jgi:SAM-dependent methyltransferase
MTGNIDNFDVHAADYDETLAASLAFTGADGRYYAGRKIDALGEFFKSCNLVSPSRVLEFGCGTGNNLPLLRTLFPGAELHGIDVSEKSLDMARALNLDRCELRSYSGGVLPYPESSFDLAMAANVFHHIQPATRPAALAAIRRTLARGGLVAIFEHNPYNPLTRIVVRDCPFDKGVVLLGHRETVALFRHAGIAVLQTRFISFVPPTFSLLHGIEKYLAALPLGAQYGVFGRWDGAA